MAQVTMTLRLDNDLLRDAFDSIAVVHLALARRHGSRFRSLDRRIDSLLDGGFCKCDIDLKTIEETFVSVPAGELAAILNEARSLGIIH